MCTIRQLLNADWRVVWRILEPVFREGRKYVCPPRIAEQDAYRVWVETPSSTRVAVDETGVILSSYYLKPNQPGLGDHVCNCSYIVAESARWRCAISIAVLLACAVHESLCHGQGIRRMNQQQKRGKRKWT